MARRPLPATPRHGARSASVAPRLDRFLPGHAHRNVARMARGIALFLVLLTGTPTSGLAAPGDLDGAFAGILDPTVGQNVMCHAVAPDGKIVLAGTSGSSIVVCRRLPNGEPDVSFGGDGTVSVTHPDGPVSARSVAVQSDGKIVVAGQGNYDGYRDFLVVRLLSFGALDQGFSQNGFASAWIAPGANYARKVLIQPDGKIVVAGSALVQGDYDFAAARFNYDGTPDASFSGDGKTSVGGFQAFGGNDECYDAVLQADGKLVMVGGSVGYSLLDEDFALARLNMDGSLDGSFDGDGRLKTGFGDFYDRALAVAIQPSDQRIVVVGQGSSLGEAGRAARYYSSDGSLDGSFDGDGKMNLPLIAHDVDINTAGKIAIIGIDPGKDARALRLNNNGTPDPEWQEDGDVFVDEDIFEPPSLSLLADGRVLTVVPKEGDCRLRQWWANGVLESGGTQVAAFDDVTFPRGSHEVALDAAVLSDGKIVLAGTVSTPQFTESDFALTRFRSNGILDNSFGVHGRVALSLGDFDYARAMAVQPDGRIVVAGYTGTGSAVNFMIARFHSNGSLDNSFGFGGFNALDFAGGADYGWAIALQPDGRILVAGTVFNGVRNVFGVARFGSDGTLDRSFDLDGKQFYEFSVGPTHWASAIVVQASGRIVVGGHVGGDFALVAFTPAGGVDSNFGTFGRTIRNLGGDDYLEALAIAPNGWIYGVGSRFIGGNGDWAIARWTANAGLVPCNPTCPWTTAFRDFGATSGWAEAIDFRGDGNFVVGGTAGSNAHWAQFTPGSTAPVVAGFATFPGLATNGTAVRFAGANRVVLAGSHGFQGDNNMIVSKFETTLNATVSVDEPMPIAATLRMAAPYPNPLIGRSTISFELPQTRTVRLAIHDVSGRRVRLLQDGELVAGAHQRLWDGTDDQGRSVAAGVFFARLDAGSEQASASLVVIR